MSRYLRIFWFTFLAVVLMWQLSFAQDGKKLYTEKFCITCHGVLGIAVVPNYPSLAGQNPRYMIQQVKDILSGKRKSNLTSLMTNNPVVNEITDKEMEAIVEYLTTLK